jgi:hypothetical protein
MSDRIAQAGLALLAALLIGAGLMAVGGPEEARRQRRDDDRLSTIIQLSGCFSRLDRAEFDALPPQVTARTPCVSELGWSDPQTSEPYRFQRGEGDSFSVCATFEKPDSLRRFTGDREVNPATGCVSGQWKGKGEIHPMDQFIVKPD